MRFLSNLTRAGVACAALAAFPTPAVAQHSLTGRLVEQLPGGGAISIPQVAVHRVVAGAPYPEFVDELNACSGGVTTNCVDGAGLFTITDLSAAIYLLRIRADGMISKVQNAVVAANSNLGDVQLIRAPFKIDMTVANIPASGGSIPVTLRVRTTWDVPTLPIVARIQPYQETTFGTVGPLAPTLLNFTWPAGFADTGVLPFTPLNVSPDALTGGANCVYVEIRLQTNPNISLGFGEACAQKEP